MQAIRWERIEEFVGYGSVDVRVLFLGIEEGLARDDSLEDDLLVRSAFHRTADLYEAQLALGGPGKHFGDNPVTQRTWRPMCHLMLRRDGCERPTREKRLRYQADRLGRAGGETLLAELLPYPNPNTADWLYASCTKYKTREVYDEQMVPRRTRLLREVLSQGCFEIVVAYGNGFWGRYKLLFDGADWTHEGPFETACVRGTRVVLAPHFAQRAFNTDEQLNAFADVALGVSSPAR
ncbi:MAG TPA: hypothetical protein VMU55_06440 [Solirubrobacteraceae bacterium]|nr:hypothetical protein [Solirubrobacteraceae bacterium]